MSPKWTFIYRGSETARGVQTPLVDRQDFCVRSEYNKCVIFAACSEGVRDRKQRKYLRTFRDTNIGSDPRKILTCTRFGTAVDRPIGDHITDEKNSSQMEPSAKDPDVVRCCKQIVRISMCLV